MVDTRTTRVLVVDDEEPIRLFVERALREAGYEIAIAANGIEALKLAEPERPLDLLITDLVMPVVRGDELARRLRQRHPDLKVLYLTGYADELFKLRITLWANEACLNKPATVTELLEAVSLILSRNLSPEPDSSSTQT
jgi:two-component system, cell cycle sensor histidine kinase and response regulator CckA